MPYKEVVHQVLYQPLMLMCHRRFGTFHSMLPIWIFGLSWLCILSCSHESRIPADFISALADSSRIIVNIGDAGGELRKSEHTIICRNAFVKMDEAEVPELVFFSSSGRVDIVPFALEWPKSWEHALSLETIIRNPNPFPVRLSFGMRGRWNRLMMDTVLSANELRELNLPLNEIAIICPQNDPFAPSLLSFEAMGETERWSLKIQSLELILDPEMKKFAVVDSFGQRKMTSWEGKVTSSKDLKNRWSKEYEDLFHQEISKEKIEEFAIADGNKKNFFRIEKRDGKWWFISPAGELFWSLGVTGVRPKYDPSDVTAVKGRESIYEWLPDSSGFYKNAWVPGGKVSYYYLNLIRKYGSIQQWRNAVLKRLPHWGLNTIGNWSEDTLLMISGMPFTKSYDTKFPAYNLGHGICDFFHPGWVEAVDSLLAGASAFRDNSCLLGYFVDNEQGWGKGEYAGLLTWLPDSCFSRRIWCSQLKNKYRDIYYLNKHFHTSFGSWQEVQELRDTAVLRKFSEEVILFETRFAEQYFRTIRNTLRKYDPHHLYLGCRFTRFPKPDHIMKAAGKYCDVITVNVYTFIGKELQIWHEATGRPVLIGEFHAPLCSGRQLPPNYKCFSETERKQYYIEYVERWAQMPFSLGCHWYQFTDQPLTGRSSNGECQTIGLVDITDQPYSHLLEAIKLVSENVTRWHNQKE